MEMMEGIPFHSSLRWMEMVARDIEMEMDRVVKRNGGDDGGNPFSSLLLFENCLWTRHRTPFAVSVKQWVELRAMRSSKSPETSPEPMRISRSFQNNLRTQGTSEAEILEQIDRDVKRTHPEMEFFCGDSSIAKTNQEALRRILIIFAKLNPSIKYVQGMNEVVAPLFYVFRNDPDGTNATFAEAGTFFCFAELLSIFRDNFCKQLDKSVVGIQSKIEKLSQLLKRHDEELWRHLEVTTKVNPQFYAFRWISLLLMREFNLTECLHIWDVLLSDPEGPQETLLRICCAMLIIFSKT
ncbi:uncharacterized protein LOC141842852 [Curcuma longa]|uniref:uncharacterized protein LOC141842852 n=1 Tax=Curcuma longa TaxID=136217 RepID=UPI003D9EDB22